MLVFMSGSAQEEVRNALALPPFERMRRLLSILAYHPDNPDFIAEILVAQVEIGHQPSEFLLRHSYELLIRDGRVLGAIVLLGRIMAAGFHRSELEGSLREVHRIAQQIDVGVAPDGELSRDYAVESAPAPDELKVWLEMMGREEMLLQADDVIEALSFDREAFIPLPVPFFSEVSFEQFVALLHGAAYSRVDEGDIILQTDAVEDFLVVPISGHVNIEVNDVHMAKVGSGIVLGEGAVLYGTPRNATAVAHEPCELLTVTREHFESLAQEQSEFRDRLIDNYAKRVRGNALNGSPIFELLDDYRQYTIIDEFQVATVQGSDSIKTDGENGDHALIVITAGAFAICDQSEKEVVRFGVNDAIGGMTIPETFRLKALSNATYIYIGAAYFQELFDGHPRFKAHITSLRKRLRLALGVEDL